MPLTSTLPLRNRNQSTHRPAPVDPASVNDDNGSVRLLRAVRGALFDRRTRSERVLLRLRPREFDCPVEDLEQDLFGRVGGRAYFLVDEGTRVFLGPLRSREEVVRAWRIHFTEVPDMLILDNEPSVDRCLIG